MLGSNIAAGAIGRAKRVNSAFTFTIVNILIYRRPAPKVHDTGVGIFMQCPIHLSRCIGFFIAHSVRSLTQQINPRWVELTRELGFERAFEHFGPYAGANIKIREIDPYTLESSMALIESNTNYVGTHFGGSLYSMCDPFFMFLLMRHLGTGYIVWDKAATIEFVKPGIGTVTARFHIPEGEFHQLREELSAVKKLDRIYACEVKDEAGDVVARLTKTLYIRRLKLPTATE